MSSFYKFEQYNKMFFFHKYMGHDRTYMSKMTHNNIDFYENLGCLLSRSNNLLIYLVRPKHVFFLVVYKHL